MELREAARQAIDALELGCTDHDGNPVDLVGPAITALRAALSNTQDWDEIDALRASLREHMAEIHRLRVAGRQALEALCLPCDRWNRRQTEIINASITTLRAALAEEKNENTVQSTGGVHSRVSDGANRGVEAVTDFHDLEQARTVAISNLLAHFGITSANSDVNAVYLHKLLGDFLTAAIGCNREGGKLSLPLESKDLSEESLNEVVAQLKAATADRDARINFTPTHMVFTGDTLACLKKLADQRNADTGETSDDPETNFGNMAQAVDCYGDGNVYHTNGMPAVEGPLSKAHRTCQESRHVEPVAYVTGYSKGYATVRPVDPCLLMPVGMALYRLPPTINEMETVELATDDCPGCLRLEDQLYDALGRLQIANLKLAGGAAIKITERKVAEWFQKEYSTDTEGTSTIKDNLIVEPVGYGVFEDGNLHDSFRLEHEATLFAALKGEHAEVGALYRSPPKREPLTDEKYNELLMAVGKKYPGETRHETALRYIRQAEMNKPTSARAIERAHGIGGEE